MSECVAPGCGLPLYADGTHDWGNNGWALNAAVVASSLSISEFGRILERAIRGERCAAPGCGLRLRDDHTHIWPEEAHHERRA